MLTPKHDLFGMVQFLLVRSNHAMRNTTTPDKDLWIDVPHAIFIHVNGDSTTISWLDQSL